MGCFTSSNFQKDYNDVVPETEWITVAFTTMVNHLKKHYRPMQNHTISNYELHKLLQTHTESFNTILNRVKHDAKNCQFSCEIDACNVPAIMMRDQINVSTSNVEIRQNTLQNQWNLPGLVFHGCQLEASE